MRNESHPFSDEAWTFNDPLSLTGGDLRPLSRLISWRKMQMLKMEREKDAEGFKEDFGQKVLGWMEEWKRGKETGAYWILTFAITPIRIKTMSWNHFCTSLFYLFEVFYQFFKKSWVVPLLRQKEEMFSIPQDRVGTPNIPRSYGADSYPFSKVSGKNQWSWWKYSRGRAQN